MFNIDNSMPKKTTQEEAEQRVTDKCIEKNYTLIEPFTYTNIRKTRLKLKCNIDGHEWTPTYHSFINSNSGCPKCAGNVSPTQKEAENNVQQKCIKMNYTLIESFVYLNRQTKLKLKCNIDGHEWETSYINFITKDRGCVKCGNRKTTDLLKTTQEEADKKVQDKCIRMNYTLLEPFVYIDANKTRLKLKCNIDGHIWTTSYNNFINNSTNCLICSYKNNGYLSRTKQEEAEQRVIDKCIRMNYTLLEPFVYIGANKTRLKLKCNIDGHIWTTSYNSFINSDNGCKICGYRKTAYSMRTTQEEAEQRVIDKCIEKNYTLIEPFVYINRNIKIHLKCNTDGHEWWILYSYFIYGDFMCPECYNNSRGIPYHLLTNWKKFKRHVDKYTRRIKKHIFKNWDGYDYYDNEYIKDYLKLHHFNKKYPTIDHKKSVYYCFNNNISVEDCASIDNICITKRRINSSKERKTEKEFINLIY